MIVKPLDHVGHQSLSVSWNDEERFSLTRDPTNLASLLLQERFPRLANPGPALEVILARFFPNLLIPASRPIGRRGRAYRRMHARQLMRYMIGTTGNQRSKMPMR